MISNGYLNGLDPNYLDLSIKVAIRHLSPHLSEFDAIAFRGVSGALAAPILGYILKKPLIVSRKSQDSAHTSCTAEGTLAARYLIVDDFYCSKSTIRETIRTIKQAALSPKPVAVYMYCRQEKCYDKEIVVEVDKTNYALPVWSSYE